MKNRIYKISKNHPEDYALIKKKNICCFLDKTAIISLIIIYILLPCDLLCLIETAHVIEIGISLCIWELLVAMFPLQAWTSLLEDERLCEQKLQTAQITKSFQAS